MENTSSWCCFLSGCCEIRKQVMWVDYEAKKANKRKTELREDSQDDLFNFVALQHSDRCVAKWLVSAVLQCPRLQWWVTLFGWYTVSLLLNCCVMWQKVTELVVMLTSFTSDTRHQDTAYCLKHTRLCQVLLMKCMSLCMSQRYLVDDNNRQVEVRDGKREKKRVRGTEKKTFLQANTVDHSHPGV